MSEALLQCESLCCEIQGRSVLNDVSLRVAPGETWSVIGPNGAGKSTLLRCLMRILEDWSGSVYFRGRDLRSYRQRELSRHLAYVPQPGGGQAVPFAVRDFIRMGRYAYAGPFGSAHPGDGAAIQSACERTGVTNFLDRRLDSLSGGERQKVFIAAALAQDCDMLLLDEPTAFLDYRHQAEVSAILNEISGSGGTTVFHVTHDVNAAMLTGGKVLALRGGETVWSGAAEELAQEEILKKIFDTSFRFIDDPHTGLRLVAPQGGTR